MSDLNLREILDAMKKNSALVHHITNWVTIRDCAQITRQWGCLPVMAHATEEVEEMTGLAGALVLNIGTLTPPVTEAMEKAAAAANRRGIPVILDVVGAGATRLRTEAARRLIQAARIDVLKGNAGEIGTLAGLTAEVRGVEAMSVKGDIKAAARELAKKLGNVVAVTGAVDVVTDGQKVIEVRAGHPLMGRVVGTGCVSTSTVGCFATAGRDLLRLTALAFAVFGIAGERAAEEAAGPGSFMAALITEAGEISEDPPEVSGRLREEV